MQSSTNHDRRCVQICKQVFK